MTVIKYDLEWSRQPAVKSKSRESGRGSERKEARRDQSKAYETVHTQRQTDRQMRSLTLLPSLLPLGGTGVTQAHLPWGLPSVASTGVD